LPPEENAFRVGLLALRRSSALTLPFGVKATPVKNLLTGSAQSVTDTNDRLRKLFQDRPLSAPLPPERKTFSPRRKMAPMPAAPERDSSEVELLEPVDSEAIITTPRERDQE